MGKKQHQKDKLYLTTKEWKEEWGGQKKSFKDGPKFYRLPFECCCLSLQPYKDPCCTKDGYIYDILNLVPFIEKFQKDPVTGEKLQVKDIIKLNISRNTEGRYHCPITRKEFTENSYIVAIKTSGNVYLLETIEQLNYKLNNFKDLLTEVPFTRKDVIVLQDSSKMERANCAQFYHVVHNLRLHEDHEDLSSRLQLISPETASTLQELADTYKPPVQSDIQNKDHLDQTSILTERTAAHFSTGTVSRSFTCSSLPIQTVQIPDVRDTDLVRYPMVKKKGYVQLVTSLGNINLQLHCELVPKTCENFMILARRGYYNDTLLFRLIPGFMVQGGDPDGTGKGGESAFKKPFKDEFRSNLRHDRRGILSMANRGKNTNTSQFFITFASCPDLDDVHTIFGSVVGGMDTLERIECVPTDEQDRPVNDITILNCNIFCDPFEQVDAIISAEIAAKSKSLQSKDLATTGGPPLSDTQAVKHPPSSSYTTTTSGGTTTIGKYLKRESGNINSKEVATKRHKPGTTTTSREQRAAQPLQDFSLW